ncbi:MAG: fluoride efflux transporter CrcB [Tannerellaceae bacterium]|jgi:CrcB protein|nr:fluoride efflux transporter CrcB [Tannerellaceae bacterium]
MLRILSLLVGGALGTLLRYGVTIGLARVAPTFPFGVLTVNTLGSFLIGLCGALCEVHPFAPALRAFLFIGLFGGFTTFSSFSLDTMELFREGAGKTAILNILLNNVCALSAVFWGFHFARRILGEC